MTLAVAKTFFQQYFLHFGDKNKRESFISNVTAYLRTHNFDGLDLHWIDLKSLFQFSPYQLIILKKELKESFNSTNMLLTSSFSAITNLMERPDFNFTTQTQYLDFVHLLQIFVDEEHLKRHTVEFVLRELNVSNVQSKVNNLIELGVNAEKIGNEILILASGRVLSIYNEVDKSIEIVNATSKSFLTSTSFQFLESTSVDHQLKRHSKAM